jgi:hypothetical protein
MSTYTKKQLRVKACGTPENGEVFRNMWTEVSQGDYNPT